MKINAYPPKINPYIRGMYLIYKRLVWDINPISFSSRKKLIKIKNKYIDEKAIIVGNGPSLLQTDLTKLNNVFVFGLNKINILFNKTNFRPDCIICINRDVAEQNADYYNQTDLPIYISHEHSDLIKNRENVTFLHMASPHSFAEDCSMSLYSGGTVTYVAMQLAFHMGFKLVGLVGMDHFFKKAIGKSPWLNEKMVGEDIDHFDPNYFKGKNWGLPNISNMEASYVRARDRFEKAGRKILNCTVGGRLEIFERIELDSFLEL